MPYHQPPTALTIAGSDSGGGAGIQADLTTFAALGVHGGCAVTAVTVQDTTGVHGIHSVPLDVVIAQVDCVVDDLDPAAVKIGMLGEAAVAIAVAELAASGRLRQLVLDPVLVATTGQSLAGDGVATALRDHLLPHAALITPNPDEAAALLGTSPAATVDEQAEQARALLSLGPRAVVVTGGRAPTLGGVDQGHRVEGIDRVDILADATGIHVFRSPEIVTRNDHGTGCTFASAAAAFLARGEELPDAVVSARAFVRHALSSAASWRLGRGRGPVAHVGTAFFDLPAAASRLTTANPPTTTQGAPR